MPFRDDLDLSGIADRYEVFNPNFRIMEANFIRELNKDRPEEPEVPKWAYEPAPAPGSGEDAARVGNGPVRCSTSRQVAVGGRPAFAWDPNRYYRDLGVPWPYVNATRKDLRLAYMDARGPESVRLTYVFKQLLNAEVRAEYDAMPLGEEYLDDYVMQRKKDEAIDRAHAATVKGNFTTPEEMLDRMGYKIVPDAAPDGDTSTDILDSDRFKRLDQDTHHQTVGAEWEYSFYLWKTTRWDYTRLAAWQSALVAELDQRNLSPTLAVGLMGKRPHPYVIALTDDGWVVFLNHEAQVTLDLAASAATALHNEIARSNTALELESRSKR